MTRWAVALALLLSGCGGGTAERDGDTAWYQGRWAVAMTSYQAAGKSPRVLAKYADAALRGGFLPEAVQGWQALATSERRRVGEASAGLARTALAAERSRNQVVLAQALAALRRMDPEWPGGRLVRHLAGDRGLNPDQAADVWLAILAAETDREAAGTALLGLARARTGQGDCARAVGVFSGAVQRLTGPARDSSLAGLARCELSLGLAALAQARDDEAERWFDRTVAHDPVGSAGRRALVGLGDARQRRGDLAAALVAWRTVVTAAVPPDSIFVLAIERLQAATAAPPDSFPSAPGWL